MGFHSKVKTTRTSFTAFCNEMTRQYRTTNVFSAQSMNVKTFVKWIFAWMSAMKIDFRKEVDPWCRYNPKILGCDGTHIGVSSKYMNLEHPITEAGSTTEKVVPMHKRLVFY